MSAAMELDARVALHWKVKCEINGKVVSEKNIGTVRQDQKNNITTFTYVGLELRPGPNTVRVVAIGPQGATGNAQELMVLGRGPTKRLEIIPEKREIQTGGRDSTTLRVRAFDQWGSPAADDQVALETSAGELLRTDRKAGAKAADNRAAEIAVCVRFQHLKTLGVGLRRCVKQTSVWTKPGYRPSGAGRGDCETGRFRRSR